MGTHFKTAKVDYTIGWGLRLGGERRHVPRASAIVGGSLGAQRSPWKNWRGEACIQGAAIDTSAIAARLPRRIEEITRDWLSEALSRRHPGVEVTSVTHGMTLAGTATKRQFRLEYNDAGTRAGLPATMWVKGGFDPSHFDLFADALVYATEARFFSELAPQLDVRVPRCFYADYDDRQGIVLLEDLAVANVEFGRAPKPVPIDAAAALNANLAKLHARWWGSPQLDAWDWIQMPMQENTGLQYFRTTSNPELIAQRLASPRGERVPKELHDPQAIYSAMLKMAPLAQQMPHCLLHADPHIGNTYYVRDAGPGLLDWQQVRKGYWAFDYTYYTVSALDIEGRRRAEVDLLKQYLGELESRAVDAPSFDQAWRDYRHFIAYGFIVWLCNPEFCQPEDVNIAAGARFAAAAADLDLFKSFD